MRSGLAPFFAQVNVDPFLDFISHSPENPHLLFLGPSSFGRIFETPVNPLHVTREDRATLVSPIANRYNDVEAIVEKSIDRFRLLRGNIDSDLLHCSDSLGMDGFWIGPRTEGSEAISSEFPKQPFGHLAPAGVTRTKKQHTSWGVQLVLFLPQNHTLVLRI